MPTYYVRADGNNSNAGTGIASTQAWQTISKALGATGITGGDTVYIAPGVYRESVTVSFSSTASTTYIIGDPRAEIFPNIAPSPVRVSCYTSGDNVNVVDTNYNITATGKSNISFKNLWLESFNTSIGLSSCNGIIFDNCLITPRSLGSASNILLRQDTSVIPHLFQNILSYGSNFIEYIPITSGIALSGFMTVNNVSHYGNNNFYYAGTAHTLTSPIYVNNCYIHDSGYTFESRGYGVNKIIVKNCVINVNSYYVVQWNQTNHVLFNYCRLCNGTNGVFNGSAPDYTNTYGNIHQGIEYGQSLFFGLQYNQMFTNYLNSPNAGMGTNVGVGTSDLYGKTWTSPNPDIGPAQYYTGNVSYYYPRDKDFNTTKIAIGSTSQSIFIYLGASGIGYSDLGLVAKYTRNKSNPVTFSLAPQTTTGSWVSGGIVETDPTNQPGLYRLDLPNEALVTGTDRVVVTVRGTFSTPSSTGTNGNYSFIDLYEPATNSSIANTVWNYASRTLSAASGATAFEIWNYANRTLSATGLSAYDIWNYTDRIITGGTGVSITQSFPENFEYMLITNTGRIYLNKADIQKIKT
jgi:hypothetical protein